MRDCWLDPDGNVYYVEPFRHGDFATELIDLFFPDWELYDGCYVETLMMKGWVRYSTATEQWCYGRDWGGWEIYSRPTGAQRDMMFDLTGEIVE